MPNTMGENRRASYPENLETDWHPSQPVANLVTAAGRSPLDTSTNEESNSDLTLSESVQVLTDRLSPHDSDRDNSSGDTYCPICNMATRCTCNHSVCSNISSPGVYSPITSPVSDVSESPSDVILNNQAEPLPLEAFNNLTEILNLTLPRERENENRLSIQMPTYSISSKCVRLCKELFS